MQVLSPSDMTSDVPISGREPYPLRAYRGATRRRSPPVRADSAVGSDGVRKPRYLGDALTQQVESADLSRFQTAPETGPLRVIA